jgi:hypothetical protein
MLSLMMIDAAAAQLTHVPSANGKAPGLTSPNILSPELIETAVAQGSNELENPAALTAHYGYDSDGPLLPALGSNVEATKTEPDKNTYLVLRRQHGVDPDYDYGQRFLYQGHENGETDPMTGQKLGYITRINLDADGAHRVTLLATTDSAGKALPVIDGSTWYPWSGRLLFSAELGPTGGIWQGTPDFPSSIEDISGVTGRGGYEAIQADSRGNVIIVEDVGGARGTINNKARQPNSFVYRLIPLDRRDLRKGGQLQVLQVQSKAHVGPIVFNHAPDVDILSQDARDLHTYNLVFDANWVTIHDTAVDGFAPFDANAAAKAHNATAFKRPENGQFRPGSRFTQLFFDETGDTDAGTQAGSDFGGFGAIYKLTLSPVSNAASLRLFYLSDPEHSSFDNVAFVDENRIVFVQDAGDMLHTQLNALDSAFLFDVRDDYSDPSTPPPVRILAQGRDPSATIDSGLAGSSGFQNDGDNEITGLHVSDGDPTTDGILGAKRPRPFQDGWRVFYTQQHGDNVTWEILRNDD